MSDATRQTIAILGDLAAHRDVHGFQAAYRAAIATSADLVLALRRQRCPLPWEGAFTHFAA